MVSQGLQTDFRPGMDVIRIEKNALLERLNANRAKHIEEYNEAVAGWKIKLKERVEEIYRNVVTDGDYDSKVDIYLPKPMSYEDDYTTALEKLNLSVDDVFELDDNEFKCFIMDQWKWKQSFTATNASYSNAR